jgi:transposase
MKNERIALGLDVSKLTVDVCLLKANGERSMFKVTNCPSGFRKLLAWLDGIDSMVHACLEPTGRYSRPLAHFLHAQGLSVSQVHSFAVQNHGRSLKFRSKNDRIDAFLLADYCLKNNPACWTPPLQVQAELRDVQHRLDSLNELIRQECNRLEAGTDSAAVLEDIKESLGRLYVRRDVLEKVAKELVKTDERLSANFAIIKSIIGLGEKSAILMLAQIDFEKFREGRQVACFAGITPGEFDSGTSVHQRASISRVGSRELRAALYFPAMTAIQHNPQMRDFADRLRARNKPPKVVICAVMRKLLVLAAALIRKQEFYNPEHRRPLG